LVAAGEDGKAIQEGGRSERAADRFRTAHRGHRLGRGGHGRDRSTVRSNGDLVERHRNPRNPDNEKCMSRSAPAPSARRPSPGRPRRRYRSRANKNVAAAKAPTVASAPTAARIRNWASLDHLTSELGSSCALTEPTLALVINIAPVSIWADTSSPFEAARAILTPS
jgi:hypothetical protein